MKNDTNPAKTRTPQRGYPVFRPTVSKILVCTCGMRYIKTRSGQDACIPCFVKARDAK
jgi:hypothetical protein